MKKNLILICSLTISALAYSQVGINTPNPQGTLHVDGAKDNPETGTPTAAQQVNDFTVTNTGNVGIGTTTPAAKLDIVGNIKITDGTQGTNRVLTSDANGVATWQSSSAIIPTALGVFPAAAPNVTLAGTAGGRKYSGIYIDVPQGKWNIGAGLTFLGGTSNSWFHAYLSSSNTSVAQNGFTHLGPSGVNSSYAGNLITNSGANFINGNSIIQVTASTVRIYIMFDVVTTGAHVFVPGAFENYFYASPIN